MNRSVALYHTLEELIGKKVTFPDFTRALAKIPRSDVLRCIAGLSALVERRAFPNPQYQIQLLQNVVPVELASRIKASLKNLREPFGYLFHRRHFWFVLQTALLVCEDDSTDTHDDEAFRAVGECCLMANDLLKQVENIQFTFDPEDTKNSLAFVISALIAYNEFLFGSEVIARAWLFWLDIPSEEPIRRLARNIGFTRTFDQAFEDSYGVPLNEFVRFTILLYYKFVESSIKTPPAACLYDPNEAFQDYFSMEHIEKSVSLLSVTPDALAARLLGTPRQSWAIDTTVLIRTPLIKLAENRYVCPDLHMFRAFFVQGVFELLVETVNPDHLKQLLGSLFERYVDRLMRSFAPSSSILANTYFNPVKFAGEKDQEVCDGLFVWSSHAMLLECKSSMLTSRQRYAMSFGETTKAIDDQLAKFLKATDDRRSHRRARKGIGQLAYSLARILSGDEFHCKGEQIDVTCVKTFYPAIVVYDECISNHAVRLYLQKRMIEWFESQGVDHSRVGHVLLFSIRDIEYFETLAHRYGAEQLIKEYGTHVEQNPRDPSSMFHIFAGDKYPEASESQGLTLETTDRILESVKKELSLRKSRRTAAR